MKTKQKHTHRTQKIKRLFAKIYTKEHVYTYAQKNQNISLYLKEIKKKVKHLYYKYKYIYTKYK